MFYNVLGSFAQFYREQLGENVRMGMHQAVRQGRWINRAKTGYDMLNGVLVPNEQAPLVREIFRLRAEGLSHQRIEDRTGVKYSTARLILQSRIYVGEVLYNGEWFPGSHEPLISREDFEAAHRGFVPGRRRLSREVLSGRVRCGLCHRLAAVEYRTNGEPVFRCKHRGQGCAMPRRASWALERAVVLGMRLLGDDAGLQAAIRREIGVDGAERPKGRATGRPDSRADKTVSDLEAKRRKLLELHYADKIGSDLYAEEELRLRQQIELATSQERRDGEAIQQADDVVRKFEEVAALLAALDVEAIWKEATQDERRVLVHELVEEVALFPDHLEVVVAGAPRLNVTLEEIGVQNCGVRGGT